MNFWKLFRLIFVLFFLYLTGDAFYRWDGFKLYLSFSEFLRSLALISVLLSVLAVLTAAFTWIFLKMFEWFCRRVKIKISINHLLLFIGFFIVLAVITYGTKQLTWPEAYTTLPLKLGILAGVTGISLSLAWMFRRKADHFLDAVHVRITPLVWLFGTIVIIFFPTVCYLAWSNLTEKKATNDTIVYSATAKKKPNIILITFDALTAKDMSVYGYNRQTTPFISEWAKSASVFTQTEAASNYTSATVASLMTGKRVWTHQRYQLNGGKPDRSDIESLPLILKNSGYYNMAFIANNIASVQELGMRNSFMVAPHSNEFMIPASLYGFLAKHFQQLFGAKIKAFDWILQEDFILYRLVPDNFLKYPYKTQFPIQKVINMFISEIDNGYSKPYFAWIHVFPPHIPYLAPEQYDDLFNPSAKFRTAKSQDDLVRPRYFAQEQQPDADILRARYDEFIRYCDSQFQDFIKQLEERDLLKDTVIILSSDHGESFEHGYFTHGGPSLFEPMTNIPLIIKEPGQADGNIYDVLVEQIDIPATILDLAGIPEPSWIEGRSLVPLLRGEKLQPKPVFSMLFLSTPEERTNGTIAVREGDYKLINYIQTDESLLFNLKDDPEELYNIIDREPDISKHLLKTIEDNLKKVQ